MDTYDVIVIGGGSAGENVVGRAAAGGLEVALVERELVGGECSFWACMPSKALLRPGEALAAVRRVPGAREAVTGSIDVAAALRWRDEITTNWDDRYQVQWVQDQHATVVRGTGRIGGERRVDVTTGDGGTLSLEARRAVVVATGSRPHIPAIDGLRDARPWDNRDATEARSIPRRLFVLGGGPVGVEFAQMFRSLGAEVVTLVQSRDRLLAREEPWASEQVRDALVAAGVDVRLGVGLTAVRRPDPGGAVTAVLADGHEVEADEILVAAGRRARTDDLGVEGLGLEPGRPIEVDDRLRATGVAGAWLYAVGDVNGRALLTHMGKYQARIAADAILGRDVSAWADDIAVPRVTFTDPQVAAVGLTEHQAREGYDHVTVVRHGTDAVAGAAVSGEGMTGTSQLVVDDDRRVAVGATFTGFNVAEMLHAATIAVAGAVPLDTLWHAVPSFPTVSEVWLRLLEAYGL